MRRFGGIGWALTQPTSALIGWVIAGAVLLASTGVLRGTVHARLSDQKAPRAATDGR